MKTTSKTTKTKIAETSAQTKLRSVPKSKANSATKSTASVTVKGKTATAKPAKTATKPVAEKKSVSRPRKNSETTKEPKLLKQPKSVEVKKKAQVKTAAMSAENSLKPKAKEEKSKTVKTKAAATTASIKEIAKPVGIAASDKTTAKRRRKVVLPIPVTPPAPPSPPRRALTSSALRAFEHAVKVFNRRQFAEAKSMFENLLAKFPGEVEIVARTQMYLQVCSQKLNHAQTAPHNADELYDRGVYALNIGDFSQAKSFFEKALRLKPEEPYLLYSLAATHAQTGAMEQALDYLKRTFQIQPRYRTQALHDADFSGLRENKQFLELLGLASPFDLLQSRR